MQQEKNHVKQVLKETVEEMMLNMGFPVEVEVKESFEEGEIFICNVKTSESNFLIGQYGVNLQSLQHIARLLARKKIAERINFVVDVNNYRQEKNESLVKLAQNMAQEAISEGRSIVLRPMSPYERRIVHMELSKNDSIKTESIGDGDDRRVVIKPADLV